MTGSGTLQRRDNDAVEESRYQMINDIATAQTIQDYETMDQLLEEYYKRDFLNSRLFELK